VLGLPLRPLRTEELIDLLVTRARSGLHTTVCYANAHTVNLACGDPRLRHILRTCEVLYADGASLVWASRWSVRRLPERMTAADYFPRFARRCAEEGLSLYLLGGRHGIAEEAARQLRARSPNLKVAGLHHGYFEADESDRLVAEINAAKPDVVVVGLSSPRQEYWVSRHAADLTAPVCWCVGGLFDYLAGRERRAPAWLCRLGCEWLFRLAVDPVGKWRRYLLGNPLFAWRTLCWAMGGPRAGHPAETVEA
jgi:N-acetylglucosaminyldiphosphoundecaprenol N-acetyl-beta-D-mannosaminyltransferase